MAGPYLPILALSRSQQIRIGDAQGGVTGNKVPGEIGTDINASGTGVVGPVLYVDLSDGTARRDLQRHGAIGGYIVVGPLSSSNANVVVTNGAVVSAGSGSNVSVTAGDLRNRTTGAVVAIAASTNSPAVTNNASGNSRIDLAVADNTSGVVTVVAGTPAVSPVAPATPAGKTPLYTFTVVTGGGVPSLFVDARPRP